MTILFTTFDFLVHLQYVVYVYVHVYVYIHFYGGQRVNIFLNCFSILYFLDLKDLIVLPLEALQMWLLVSCMCRYVAERRESGSTLSILAYDSLVSSLEFPGKK